VAQRFEQQYRTKRLDNLGDPEFHNRRWADIDRRMDARENDATKIDNAVDSLKTVALSRLNDDLTPIIQQAIDRLVQFGLLFSAHSHTERTIELGNMQFLIDEGEREGFVATGFLIIRPVANLAIGMTARTLDYVPQTGVLTVESYTAIGGGVYAEWSIGVTGDPDLAHSTRSDNPHQVTAEQVGAYSKQQSDNQFTAEIAARTAMITDALNTLVGGAPSTLNTLAEIAQALGNDANYSGTIETALSNRVRYDDNQTLSIPQKQQVGLNVGGTSARMLLPMDTAGRLPRVDASAIEFVSRVPEGRLNLNTWQTGNLSNTYSQVIYYNPVNGKTVPVYDPAYGYFRARQFTLNDTSLTGLSLNMAGNAAFPVGVYDLWIADVGGAIALGVGPSWPVNHNWSGGAPIRNVAQGGVPTPYAGLFVNSAPMPFRYGVTNLITVPAGHATWVGTCWVYPTVGIVRMDRHKGDEPGQYGCCGLWNKYNKIRQAISRSDTLGSYTHASGGAWSPQANHTGCNDYIFWVTGETAPYSAYYRQMCYAHSAGGIAYISIGLNGNPGYSTYGYAHIQIGGNYMDMYAFADLWNVNPGMNYLSMYTVSSGVYFQFFGTHPNCQMTLNWDC